MLQYRGIVLLESRLFCVPTASPRKNNDPWPFGPREPTLNRTFAVRSHRTQDARKWNHPRSCACRSCATHRSVGSRWLARCGRRQIAPSRRYGNRSDIAAPASKISSSRPAAFCRPDRLCGCCRESLRVSTVHASLYRESLGEPCLEATLVENP